MTENYKTGSGLSFLSVLTLIFITLKLTGVINWSWWWILSPIWISISLAIIVFIIILSVLAITKE